MSSELNNFSTDSIIDLNLWPIMKDSFAGMLFKKLNETLLPLVNVRSLTLPPLLASTRHSIPLYHRR